MTRYELTLRMPMRLKSLPNLREHPLAFAREKARSRKATLEHLAVQAGPFRRLWRTLEGNPKFRLQVVMVRSGPQKLDDDNCIGAFKPVRDAIASFFDINDASDRWEWVPAVQEKGAYAVRVHLEVIDQPAFEHPAVTKLKRAGVKHIGTTQMGSSEVSVWLADWSKKKRKPTPNVRGPR